MQFQTALTSPLLNVLQLLLLLLTLQARPQGRARFAWQVLGLLLLARSLRLPGMACELCSCLRLCLRLLVLVHLAYCSLWCSPVQLRLRLQQLALTPAFNCPLH